MPRLPQRAWPLWLAAALLWFGMIPVYAGAENGRPLLIHLILAAMFSPAIALFVTPYLVRYRAAGCPVLVFRASGVVATLLSIVSLLVSLASLLMTIGLMLERSLAGKIAVLAYWIAWTVYLQYLRAATIHRSSILSARKRLRVTFA